MDNSPLTDDEIIQALVDAGLFDPKTQQNLQRERIGENLASTPMPQGVRTGGAYGTYVAPNPLQSLGAGVQRAMGMSQLHQGLSGQDQNIGALGQANQAAGTDQLARIRALLGGGAAAGGAAPDFLSADMVPFAF